MPSSRRRIQQSKKQDTPPGSPVYNGEDRDVVVKVEVLDYDSDGLREHKVETISQLASLQQTQTVTWVNLDGIHRAERVQAICKLLDIHPLWMEDILNPGSRPKMEVYGGKLFVVVKMLRASGELEQVSIVMGEGVVVTFQERPGDAWQPLRARIRSGQGRIRQRGADYLLHALLDAIVDRYFLTLEEQVCSIDRLEDAAMAGTDIPLAEIYQRKSELVEIRNAVWPMRELGSAILRGEGDRVSPETMPYFRDLYDHIVQVMDMLETCRERTMSLFELRLAVDGMRLNENMRVLTVISSMFIPLTFIVGVYGMNFQHMPELSWQWAYPAVWAVMIVMSIGMLLWFRTRRWL